MNRSNIFVFQTERSSDIKNYLNKRTLHSTKKLSINTMSLPYLTEFRVLTKEHPRKRPLPKRPSRLMYATIC
jgi:hypothetical protein